MTKKKVLWWSIRSDMQKMVSTIQKYDIVVKTRKTVLHQIVTADEKWIYFKNPKRIKSWVNPGNALCLVGSEGCGISDLLKPGKTVDTNRYRQ